MAYQKTIKNWIRDKINYHSADMSRVKPEFRYSHRENAFYLNSCAGLIRFTSRDRDEMNMFRSTYINRFSISKTNADLFALYKEIISSKWSKKSRVNYKSNIRTKMKMMVTSAS